MKEFEFLNGCELESTKRVCQLLKDNPYCHTCSMDKVGQLENVHICFKDISGQEFILEWYSDEEETFSVYFDLTDIDFGHEYYGEKPVKDVVAYLDSLPHFLKV